MAVWVAAQIPAAMLLLLAWCAAASPTASDGTWRINTVLLEPALRGATQLAVKDCRGITKQGRLRLSFAEEEEEEAAVASIDCPAKSLMKASFVASSHHNIFESLVRHRLLAFFVRFRCRPLAPSAGVGFGMGNTYICITSIQGRNLLRPSFYGNEYILRAWGAESSYSAACGCQKNQKKQVCQT